MFFKRKSPENSGLWRRVWDSNPRDIAVKRFSRPPRYDRFDNPPYELVNTERFERRRAEGASASWLIGVSRYNPPYELVNAERSRKRRAEGASASWLIGVSRYMSPYRFYPPIVTQSASFVKRAKQKGCHE